MFYCSMQPSVWTQFVLHPGYYKVLSLNYNSPNKGNKLIPLA